MNKRVEVASTNSRFFVQAVIDLAKQGAILPDDSAVRKGIMLSCQLEVPEDVVVKASPVVRILPTSNKEREAYAKEQAQKNVIPVKKQEDASVEEKPAPAKRGRKPAAKPDEVSTDEA